VTPRAAELAGFYGLEHGTTPRCGAAGTDIPSALATMHDGVLEVTIPLPKEAAKEPITITPTAA
jgi:hypothetical protein